MDPGRTAPRPALLLAAVLGLTAGCGTDGDREYAGALREHAVEDAAAEPTDGAASTYGSAEPNASAPPANAADPADPELEYFYDLTRFDWYRRGEPLRIGDRAYQPAGRPEATRARRFRQAGEYLGVTYYVVEEGGPDAARRVYVPVYPGYWLPFAPVGGEAGG